MKCEPIHSEKFGHLSDDERALLFEALLYCIESNSGIGFRGHCQDRIEYQAGARGAAITPTEDNESKNLLFRFFRELSLHLADSGQYKQYNRRFGITDWNEFCKKAVDGARGCRTRYTPLIHREGCYDTPGR